MCLVEDLYRTKHIWCLIFCSVQFLSVFLLDVTRPIDVHEYHEFVHVCATPEMGQWLSGSWTSCRRVVPRVSVICAPRTSLCLMVGCLKKQLAYFSRGLCGAKNGSARSSASFLSHFDSSVDRSSPAKVPTVHTMRNSASTNWYDFDRRCWINVPGSCDATVQCAAVFGVQKTPRKSTQTSKNEVWQMTFHF